MTNAYTLTLTDDEAAALALEANGAWRTPLPTVDLTSAADVAQAVLRGRRSLAVRDLATPGGTAVAEAAEVLKRLGGGPRAMFMLVDSDGNWVPAGLTVYLYGARVNDVEMSHVVSAAGVHYFRVMPPGRQWYALTELAEAVYADGFNPAANGAQQPAAAVLVVVREQGIRSVRIAPGSASAGDPGPVAFGSVAEAAAWLLT